MVGVWGAWYIAVVEQKVQTGAMEIDVEKSGELENIVIRAGRGGGGGRGRGGGEKKKL